MIIDVQHHWYSFDPYALDYIGEPLEKHIAEMDKYRIQKAILTNNVRYPDEPSVLGDYKMLNSRLEEGVRKYPDRFIPVPGVPLVSKKSGLSILEEATSKLEASAVFIRPIDWRIDSADAWAIFEKISDLDLTIFIHGSYPQPDQLYKPYHLGGAIGFALGTLLAMSHAIYSGLLEVLPKLRFVIADHGGGLPFLIDRLDNIYEISDSKIPKKPSEYFKKLYFDTLCYDQPPLDYTCKKVGPDKLLFGTDTGCPFPIFTKVDLQLRMVNNLKISDEDKQKILGGNAAKLLKIKESEKSAFTVPSSTLNV